MRALLIVNPRATSTTRLRRDVIASALASAVKLEVVETRYRGHATTLAASARTEGFGLVLTLGGDGTVNEAVNGLLAPVPYPQQTHNDRAPAPADSQRRARETSPDGADRGGLGGAGGGAAGAGSADVDGVGRVADAHSGGLRGAGGVSGVAGAEGLGRLSADELPAFAALPGGSGNVFAGALGLARDPIDATGQILQALTERRERTIGLGLADGRYFTFNSGVGLDAEVVRAVQGLRAHGRQATPSLYVRLALRQFYKQTDRSKPAVWIDTDDRPAGSQLPRGRAADEQAGSQHPAGLQTHGPVFLGIVSNTAPWTYLGGREVNANPEARFDTGLDVFALTRMSSFSTFYAVMQMLVTKGGQLHGRSVLALHDQFAVTLRADRPVAFQIDGEYVGEREFVRLRSVPAALRVLA